MLTLDDDVKKLIKETEHNLLVKIDELKFNQDKVREEMKAHQDDDASSVQQSTRVQAQIVAAPIVVVPAASSNMSEMRSNSPSGGKKSRGIS